VLLELEQLLRQTDGVRLVVSSRAIFNADFNTHIQSNERANSIGEGTSRQETANRANRAQPVIL